jgi:hypothetical protein
VDTPTPIVNSEVDSTTDLTTTLNAASEPIVMDLDADESAEGVDKVQEDEEGGDDEENEVCDVFVTLTFQLFDHYYCFYSCTPCIHPFLVFFTTHS